MSNIQCIEASYTILPSFLHMISYLYNAAETLDREELETTAVAVRVAVRALGMLLVLNSLPEI